MRVAGSGHHQSLRCKRLAVALRERPQALPRDSIKKLQLALYALADEPVHRCCWKRARHGCVFGRQCHVPTPLVHEAVDSLVVRHDVIEDTSQGAVDGAKDQVVLLDATLPALRDQSATRIHLGLQHFIELPGVKLVARATLEWIVQVHDDDVKFGLTALQPRLGIVNHKLQALVGEGGVVLFQMFTAEVHDVLVNVHHDTALHAPVPEDLPRSAALASTADVHRLGLRVQQHGWVHETLVVHKLVDPAALNEPVDDERPPKSLQVNKVHLLELGRGRT
mmetsp:Transcript_83069/g.192973  ORF Transcript_83069/g.192973 Transcript_83069/m.192973 type:complete len:279 (+) Transcript_83069:236-1072(+)